MSQDLRRTFWVLCLSISGKAPFLAFERHTFRVDENEIKGIFLDGYLAIVPK